MNENVYAPMAESAAMMPKQRVGHDDHVHDHAPVPAPVDAHTPDDDDAATEGTIMDEIMDVVASSAIGLDQHDADRQGDSPFMALCGFIYTYKMNKRSKYTIKQATALITEQFKARGKAAGLNLKKQKVVD
ncbi:hypothetical protein NUW58_g10447 [Xylaria curta]|uniref:Uncharacterized protein n=1 Tax=Xylaria curta TaxID=42375 RepID=A0ACC1MM97_9PEZI|nr:hypothetical protein NUW58_g10447 [Xylaria curta]